MDTGTRWMPGYVGLLDALGHVSWTAQWCPCLAAHRLWRMLQKHPSPWGVVLHHPDHSAVVQPVPACLTPVPPGRTWQDSPFLDQSATAKPAGLASMSYLSTTPPAIHVEGVSGPGRRYTGRSVRTCAVANPAPSICNTQSMNGPLQPYCKPNFCNWQQPNRKRISQRCCASGKPAVPALLCLHMRHLCRDGSLLGCTPHPTLTPGCVPSRCRLTHTPWQLEREGRITVAPKHQHHNISTCS